MRYPGKRLNDIWVSEDGELHARNRYTFHLQTHAFMRPCIPSCAVVHRDARAPQILPARNIDCMHNIAARTQHYSVHAATAQCTCIPACALRKRSGTREVEVLRCFRAQCLPSLSKSLTSVRWSKETSHKISFPPCIPSAGEQQSTSHAPFSYPNPAGPVRAAAL
jgi:hypothetical protein